VLPGTTLPVPRRYVHSARMLPVHPSLHGRQLGAEFLPRLHCSELSAGATITRKFLQLVFDADRRLLLPALSRRTG